MDSWRRLAGPAGSPSLWTFLRVTAGGVARGVASAEARKFAGSVSAESEVTPRRSFSRNIFLQDGERLKVLVPSCHTPQVRSHGYVMSHTQTHTLASPLASGVLTSSGRLSVPVEMSELYSCSRSCRACRRTRSEVAVGGGGGLRRPPPPGQAVQEDQPGLVDGPSGKSEALFSKFSVAAATTAASCLDLNVEPDCWIKAGGVGGGQTAANYWSHLKLIGRDEVAPPPPDAPGPHFQRQQGLSATSQ